MDPTPALVAGYVIMHNFFVIIIVSTCNMCNKDTLKLSVPNTSNASTNRNWQTAFQNTMVDHIKMHEMKDQYLLQFMKVVSRE